MLVGSRARPSFGLSVSHLFAIEIDCAPTFGVLYSQHIVARVWNSKRVFFVISHTHTHNSDSPKRVSFVFWPSLFLSPSFPFAPSSSQIGYSAPLAAPS